MYPPGAVGPRGVAGRQVAGRRRRSMGVPEKGRRFHGRGYSGIYVPTPNTLGKLQRRTMIDKASEEHYRNMQECYEQIEKYNKSTNRYLTITEICLGLVCVIQVLLLTGVV